MATCVGAARVEAPGALHTALCRFHAAFWQAAEQYWARMQTEHFFISSSASLTAARFSHLGRQTTLTDHQI